MVKIHLHLNMFSENDILLYFVKEPTIKEFEVTIYRLTWLIVTSNPDNKNCCS